MSVFRQFSDSSVADSAANGVRQRTSKRFPSPWLDPASTELPTDLEQVLRFCELLWYSNGVYQQAMNRVAAYFVTKIKVEDVGAEDQEWWSRYLEDDLNIKKLMVSWGRNFLAYGNVFGSPRITVRRLLRCSSCGQIAPLTAWKFALRGKSSSRRSPARSARRPRS